MGAAKVELEIGQAAQRVADGRHAAIEQRRGGDHGDVGGQLRRVVAHEAVKTGGAGAEIPQSAIEGAFDFLQAPIIRVASKELPIPTGKLQDQAYTSSDEVGQACREVRR